MGKVSFLFVMVSLPLTACRFDPLARVGGADSGRDGAVDAFLDAMVDRDAAPSRDGDVGPDGAPQCGDGVRQPGEDCDGTDLGGETCEHLGFAGGTLSCNQGCTLDMSRCQVPADCGDGVLDQAETCDDGNGVAGDGCSPSCRVEQGWECSGTPSVCRPICGDGQLVGTETCDDGNQIAGDGCDAQCRVEDYFSCDGAPSRCICRVLVDMNAGGPQSDGKTWASAHHGIQDGIDQASAVLRTSLGVARCQVWVAQGTYEIFQGAWSDTVSLADRVDLLGGFCGTESAPSQRPGDLLDGCPTTLDGMDPNDSNNAVDRVVTAEDSGDATLEGFEITGGWNDGDGGGLFVSGMDLEVRNCAFHDNGAENGGAVFLADGATADFLQTSFQDNSAWNHGGALYLEGGCAATVQDATALTNRSNSDGGAFFVRNGATLDIRGVWMEGNHSGDDAGALGIRGTATVQSAKFFQNSANDTGGAVRVAYGGSATFQEVVFEENQADRGGAVMVYDNQDQVSARFDRCRFLRNRASSQAGAVRIGQSAPGTAQAEFHDSLFYRNRIRDDASHGGAGFLFGGATANLVNCTVVSNRATDDSGRTGGFRVGTGSSLAVHNSIFWANQGLDLSTWGGGSVDLASSDVENHSGNIHDQGGNISQSPGFLDPGNQDFRLEGSSPCLDAGDDSVASQWDLDHSQRKVDLPGVGNDGSNVVDMGAFERQQ